MCGSLRYLCIVTLSTVRDNHVKVNGVGGVRVRVQRGRGGVTWAMRRSGQINRDKQSLITITKTQTNDRGSGCNKRHLLAALVFLQFPNFQMWGEKFEWKPSTSWFPRWSSLKLCQITLFTTVGESYSWCKKKKNLKYLRKWQRSKQHDWLTAEPALVTCHLHHRKYSGW